MMLSSCSDSDIYGNPDTGFARIVFQCLGLYSAFEVYQSDSRQHMGNKDCFLITHSKLDVPVPPSGYIVNKADETDGGIFKRHKALTLSAGQVKTIIGTDAAGNAAIAYFLGIDFSI